MGKKCHWGQPSMSRIAISVEGSTEREFINRVLAPYLWQMHPTLSLHPISLDGSINIARISHEINKRIHNFDGFTTLYDFYGFNNKATLSHEELTLELKDSITRHQDRFIPYIQKYEFECLLFSCPDTLMNNLTPHDINLSLTKEVKHLNTPEKINDSKITAPSKRLKKYFIGYDKVLHGTQVTTAIGIPKIREKCPLFSAWIDDIIALHQHISTESTAQ